jgi:acyl-coenzyme A synthetase/AMP-(fatty) acid ligase
MMPLKVPDKIVFVESIPKNSSGKPSRRDLKSLVDTVLE